MRRAFVVLLAVLLLMASSVSVTAAASGNGSVGINVALTRPASAALLADIGRFGQVLDVYENFNALTMKVREADLARIRALPYVAAANQDARRVGKPVPINPATGFADGIGTWNLDMIDATDVATDTRQVSFDGTGVYVAVLDTGLLSSWPFYYGDDRIAEEYAVAFGGGGGEHGTISTQPNKWQLDQDSHGTHVTSIILGYQGLVGGQLVHVNGVAPGATVIPVKVLGQNGSGWSSTTAHGIDYIVGLKRGPLAGSPVVINMSLGGPELDAVEKAAIDAAIAAGVIVVVAAGNDGEEGMSFPGAYPPVISVGSSGWTGEWQAGGDASLTNWWWSDDVAEGDATVAGQSYISDFSGRQLSGQQLDLAAPGSWVVGPYQSNGQLSYFFVGGTSQATPHVTGAAALLAQQSPGIGQAAVETRLKTTATPLAAGCRMVVPLPGVPAENVCWAVDATGAGILDLKAALGLGD
jgi:subtilisin family serine protease